MKCTKLVLGGLLILGGAAYAMPTPADTKKVEPLVADLMKDDNLALKSGKKTRVEVADAAMGLAEQADSEAAKLLLIKGAFNLYVRAGEFDKAIETLQKLQTAIPDIPPANMANIIESSLRSVSRKNGGQLYRLLDDTKTRMRYTNETKSLEKSVKDKPTDMPLKVKLAEHYAYLGQWNKALENFAASGGKASAIAKGEIEGNGGEKAADFWWSYPNGKSEELVKSFRTHAAKLYEDAIASGKISGLNKVQAERRIAETKEYGEQQLFAETEAKDGLYCVIDLSGGPNAKKYPVSYLNDVPKGGWTDEYKTTKLVLRRIEPGSFACLPGKKLTITKPFNIGVFMVTQKQYELVMENNPAKFKGATRPVECVSYAMLRGENKGSLWPKTDEVDADTFIGMIRQRTGLHFDLPTEAQWEYACRAGTVSIFNNGSNSTEDALKLGKCAQNGGSQDHHIAVGSFAPNNWGCYDMHGSLFEWCLDHSGDDREGWRDWTQMKITNEIDPSGPEMGSGRVCRSSAWNCEAYEMNVTRRYYRLASVHHEYTGFRLAIQPPFVPMKPAEKK